MKKLFDFVKSELGRITVGGVLFVSAMLIEHFAYREAFPVAALILYVLALLFAGLPVFVGAVRGILRRDLLDEKFLMSIASIGAMFVGEWHEGVAVMLFFLVGEFFEHKAVAKSRSSIRALMDIRADEASVLTDDGEEVMDADDVEIGSTIIIRAGERVPIDATVIKGSADVDTAALTGESIPIQVAVGDTVSSGFVVLNGVLTAKTVKLADDSAAARILELVENANEKKSKTEAFITKFSHFYTPIVVSLALLLAIIPPIFNLTTFSESVYRALIFLVISCPCALVISVPMAFFGGIGGAASKGILFKGGNTFSALAKADTFAFDKTGTLTSGEFKVDSVITSGIDERRLKYLAASAEYGSNHPIAGCVKKASDKMTEPEDVTELAGKGVSATVDGCRVLIGTHSFLAENGITIADDVKAVGSVFVAVDGEYRGCFVLSDTPRAEASSALSRLRRLGAKRLVILSGDKREKVRALGDLLNVDDACYELLPEDKFSKVEEYMNCGNAVYVGDGINDAPTLARCDVGIAMGGIGQDSAIEAADVVISSDDLGKIPTAVGIARKTVRISFENIIFALGVKGAILILGALGFANMWLAVFADVGVAALAILNSMRTLRVK